MPIPQVPSQLMSILASKTYNAAWFSGTTVEEQIQNAINTAAADGATIVFIPASMLPYNESLVTESVNVTLMYEGAGADSLNAAAFPGTSVENRIETAMDAAIALGLSKVVIPESFIPYNAGLITQTKFGQVRLIREGGNQAAFDISAYGAPIRNTTLPAPDILPAFQRACYAASAFGGGVVDARHQHGKFYISGDFGNNWQLYDKTPIEIHFGPAEYFFVTRTDLRSHKHIWLHNSWLKSADANGNRVPSIMFYLQEVPLGGPGNGVITTASSAVITKKNPGVANWGYLEVGSPLAIFGRLPYLGKDATTINIGGGIDAVTTSITVTSTTGFPSNGYIRIENEIIVYTSVDATHFLGCTRGAIGSTAATHANGTSVERCVYEAFVVKSISGNDITLDSVTDPRAIMDASWGSGSEGAAVQIGALDVRFEGTGKIDGMWRETGAGEATNPSGIFAYYSRKLYIGPGIQITGWEFGGVSLNAGQDAQQDCSYDNCGNRFEQVGSAFWWFGGTKRCTAHIPSAIDCMLVAAIDDRSTSPVLFDMPCWGNTVVCDFVSNVGGTGGVAFLIGGSHDNVIHVKVARNIPASAAFAQFQVNQWITNVAGEGNHFRLDNFQGDPTAVAFGASSAYADKKNTIEIYARGCIVNSLQGIGLTGRTGRVVLTFGASVPVDASLGSEFFLTATSATAPTIGNPSNPIEGQIIIFDIYNNSGGAMGATTWSGNFKLAGAWVNPANTNHRLIAFRRSGSAQWLELWRSAADVPN